MRFGDASALVSRGDAAAARRAAVFAVPVVLFSSFARCASRPESGYLLPVTQNAAVVVGFSGRHVGLGRLFVPVRAAGHIGAANGTFSIFSDLNGAPGEA